MLHVILIDDEPLIRNGLQKMFSWEDFHMEISAVFPKRKSCIRIYSDASCRSCDHGYQNARYDRDRLYDSLQKSRHKNQIHCSERFF